MQFCHYLVSAEYSVRYSAEYSAEIGFGRTLVGRKPTRWVEVDELLAVAVLVVVEGGRDWPGVGRRGPAAARLAQQPAADPAGPNHCSCNATDRHRSTILS